MNERQTRRRPTTTRDAIDRRMCGGDASALLLALAFASILSLSACAERGERSESVPATPSPAPTASAPTNQPAQPALSTAHANNAAPAPAAPPAAELNDKIAHVFGGAVELDSTQKTPALVGDFNGDGSEDIALVVRPTASGLEEINSEVSNWILVDPRQVVLPDPHKAVQKLPPAVRVKAERGDELIAVIHGYGQNGWRDAAAQQTYLLRNAAGRNPQVATKQDASYRFNLRFHGDVIDEELAGSQGVLQWTGATYAWIAAPAKR